MSFSESSAAAMVRSMSSVVGAAETKAAPNGEGARMIDGTGRRDMVHQLGAAAVGCDGKAAADNFAEGGQIGFDFEKLLRGAVVQAEAGDDFIHDEQRALLFCDVAKSGQEIGR